MNKKEEFKEFAKNNKHLSSLVLEGKTTWQKLFETFDIYGSESDVWDEFKEPDKKQETTGKGAEGVKNIINNFKNIDMDKLEENITSLQKALGFLEEIALSRSEKKEEKIARKKKTETTIERFFDD